MSIEQQTELKVTLEELLIHEVVMNEDHDEEYYADHLNMTPKERTAFEAALTTFQTEQGITNLDYDEEYYEDTQFADTWFSYTFTITYQDNHEETRYLLCAVYDAFEYDLLDPSQNDEMKAQIDAWESQDLPEDEEETEEDA